MVSIIGNDSSSVVQVFKQQRQQVEKQKIEQNQEQQAKITEQREQVVKQEIARTEQRKDIADDERRGRSVDISV